MKNSTIEKRIAELTKFYQDLPDDKMALAVPLIQNAAFIENEMAKLQKAIEEDGAVDEYVNGANQYGKKQSANLQSYNALVKSYNMINQRLEGMLMPKSKGKSKLTELMNE